MIYTITVAFAPAAQVARSILLYRKTREIIPHKHIVALGYYPVNCEKNNRDIKLLCDAFGDIEVWDPGSDLGSAQTQNWVLDQLTDCDYWINLDPDSACLFHGWDNAMKKVLDFDPRCILISCYSPLVTRYLNEREVCLEWLARDPEVPRFGIAACPVPFNLSMWRQSFIKSIGGVPQMGARWGETEGPLHSCATNSHNYHAYLHDYMEDENGKLMQDRQLLEYKDAHLRFSGTTQFPGFYCEYLRWKYIGMAETDTLIPDGTIWQ